LSRNLKVKIYKTVNLPVSYGRETWSVTLREEHRLRVFENRVLRKIFGPKRDEVIGEWRKLHSRELHNLYSSPDIIRQIKSRRMRWAGHVARMEGGEEKCMQGFGGKARRKETTRKTEARWEDGIKMDLRRLGGRVWSRFNWLGIGIVGGLL
jgi:hypothetical protein